MGSKYILGRQPLPNELTELVASLIAFISSTLDANLLPKEELLNWASIVQFINTLIQQIEEHLKAHVTKTSLKKLIRSYKALLAQAETYFGAQQWQQFKELEIMPKTYSSSNVLVDMDLMADHNMAEFQDEEVAHAHPNFQHNTGFVSSASHQLHLANELHSNSPNTQDISTAGEYASNMTSTQRPSAVATPEEWPTHEKADDDELSSNICGIHEEDFDSDESDGSSSDSDIWDYDLSD